jgi:Animal haem peroxidase
MADETTREEVADVVATPADLAAAATGVRRGADARRFRRVAATATTPVTPPPHGIVPRGLDTTPSSSTTSGRFGRMFRHLPVYLLPPTSLDELGRAMIQPLEQGRLDKPLGAADDDENTAKLGAELRLPAGYTYFGQFVDHDITFDPVSSLNRQNDPDALVDFRTPRFDLDSLYGRGPADQPYLYEPDGLRLALGAPRGSDPRVNGPDLQRGAGNRALIGDPRNDENLIVSQLQVAFIKFHNAVVHKVGHDDPALPPSDRFKLAQATVRWHYQWVVIHDFLRRLVGQRVIDDILPEAEYMAPGGPQHLVMPRLLFYSYHERPFMPVEFSVAAYRYGHSMARPTYLINDVVPVPVVPNASRIPFFSQQGGERQNLNGFRPLPTEWGVQWKYFLAGIDDAAGDHDNQLPQPSYKIDHELGHPLGALPDSVARAEQLFAGVPAQDAQSLAVRNLLRGQALGLPSGQDVARRMGIEPLTNHELFGDLGLSGETTAALAGKVPLWFYVLREAELLAGGAHLGPVGGRIVAEVLIGLLAADPLSYLNVSPGWRPTLQGRAPGTFTLADIVNLGRQTP